METRISFEQRVEVLKALADSSRLAVVNALLERPHCAEELATRLRRAPSTITFHLKKLEEAGLVKRSRNQYYGIFELRTELLEGSLRDFITQPSGDDSPEQKRLQRYREKVLHTFIKNGKLLQLPKQWKKRRIILDELVTKLDQSKEYTESELNEALLTFFPDYCTLRRLLIDEGYMVREGTRYRFEERPTETMETRAEIKRVYKETPRQAFGADAFLFEILEAVKPSDDPEFNLQDELSKLEQSWISKLEPFGEKGYNSCPRIRE